jgi:hypothetical protein
MANSKLRARFDSVNRPPTTTMFPRENVSNSGSLSHHQLAPSAPARQGSGGTSGRRQATGTNLAVPHHTDGNFAASTVSPKGWLDVYQKDFVANPRHAIQEMCNFLGVECSANYLEAGKSTSIGCLVVVCLLFVCCLFVDCYLGHTLVCLFVALLHVLVAHFA